MDTKQRTAAQAEAARRNGRMSAGPATPLGKLKVSANGVAHGLRSERVVLAHEDPVAYTEHVQSWVDALVPLDEAELEVIVGVADLRWRLRRIDAVEMNRHRAELLAQAEETPEHKRLQVIENAAAATKVMAETLAVPRQLGAEGLQRLLSLVSRVVQMVQEVEKDQDLQLGSNAVADEMAMLAILSGKDEPDPACLDELCRAAQACMGAVAAQTARAREAAEKAREKLAATVPLPDGKQQALLTRYRKDIERRLASEMAFLTAVRERKVHVNASSGSLGQPVPVTIRLVG